MRLLGIAAPFCAGLLVACDLSSTRPLASGERAAGKPEKLLLASSGWTLVSLPFTPAAMNDAGVIVGSQNGEAVRWESGTVTVLPHVPGLGGPYTAKAISPNGLIAGSAMGHVLLWTSPTTVPTDVSVYPWRDLDPIAVNDNPMIIGNVKAYGMPDAQPWRWTPASGITFLYETNSMLTDLNASGYASGISYWDAAGDQRHPIRWSPSGYYTTLPIRTATGVALGVNDGGTVVGSEEHDCYGGATYTPCPFSVALWGLNGSFTTVSSDAYPAYAYGRKISNPGRVTGNAYSPFTYYNGVWTWLSSPDVLPPQALDVNFCGSIIGTRQDVPGTGYLWRRGSNIMAACDVTYATLGAI